MITCKRRSDYIQNLIFLTALITTVIVSVHQLAVGFACAKSVVNKDGTMTHYLHFQVMYASVTRLCYTKQLVSVNGQFPGPNVYVRTGDRVIVRVSNQLDGVNVTIHWHGVRQFFSNWADGPAFITQCPLQPNTHYDYKFTVVKQTGTLFWHAHINWLRATLYGAFIIQPRNNIPYPFPTQPVAEFPILIGDWWNTDVALIEKAALATGAGFNISDAITINGQPGFLYNCSEQDTTTFVVEKGKTYLLRMVNAAMNDHMFFSIANHKLTVVEMDGAFTKPYQTEVIVLSPGNTADVLVTADQAEADYAMAAAVYSPAPVFVTFPMAPATGVLRYKRPSYTESPRLPLPALPLSNDSAYALGYAGALRSLNSKEYPENVPQTVDRSFFFTVGLAVQECPANQTCQGPPGELNGPPGLASASINNITFVTPNNISILQAYYERAHYNDSTVVLPKKWRKSLATAEAAYEDDFPSVPMFQYNYTGVNPANKHALLGTKVVQLELGTNVQLVLQNDATTFMESHPFHLHGYNFYVVGRGLGNFNASSDPSSFNLVDPPAMNNVAVPRAGWVALRFYTDNPGAWLMHCHFDIHSSRGMMMVWIVKEGNAPQQKLPPPPNDYPMCS